MVNKRLINTGVEAAPAGLDPLQNFETVTYTGNGGTQKITGYIRKGAAFGSSTTSQITLPDSIDSDLTASVSFWFKLSEVQTNGTFLFYFTRNGWGFNAYVAQDRTLILQACRQSDSTQISYSSSASYVVLGDWYHICITRSSNEAKYYINGSLVETDSYDGTRKTNNYPNSIGNFNSSSYETRGVIDQFRVFNRVLDETNDGEVTTLYNETYASSTKSTTDIFGDSSGVALYELDEDANSSNFGQAAVFNGSSSYIDTNYSTTYQDPISISAWVKTTATNSYIFGPQTYQFSRLSALVDGNGKLQAQVGFNTIVTLNSATSINDNNWHHICFTFDGNNGDKAIYVDGVLEGDSSVVSDNNTTAFNMLLGRRQTNYFNGSIDQVRIYNTALSSGDVTNLYNESNVPTSGLVAHYKLDGNATDETGSYDGTETSITYSAGVYGGTPTNVNFLGMAFQPDLVWVKHQNHPTAHSHNLADSVRGATKLLYSNTTDAEETITNSINSFNSNGFSVGNSAAVNDSGYNYVAWCWKAGGAAVSNTDGTIASQVSSNPDAGFSIVKFTTPSSGNTTTGHGLSSTPELIIYKRTATTSNWIVYHSSLGVNQFLFLNTTASATTDTGIWSTPTSTTIPLNVNKNVNGPSDYIAYCFHSVDGYQKVGSYTGTGQPNNDVTTGFRPRWVMIKSTAAQGWNIVDSVRNPSNPANLNIQANTSDAESSTANPAVQVDFDDTGFSLVAPAGTPGEGQVNSNGTTYIYLAIA